uniref:Uncharacterized protein n=1 Tax=Rhodnius prolixus TaxID=13249 RepID=T1HLI1_RHOPR
MLLVSRLLLLSLLPLAVVLIEIDKALIQVPDRNCQQGYKRDSRGKCHRVFMPKTPPPEEYSEVYRTIFGSSSST